MNGIMVLISGILILLGAAGFSMINIGLSRAHASATLCLTSLGIFAVSILSFHFIGQSLMYADDKNEFLGLCLAVLASSIFMGALTERMKISAPLVFAAIFSAIIFPVVSGLAWSEDALAGMGFIDFGGSSTIHIAAGAAALTGSYIMGPRTGRYAPDGTPIPFSGSNIPLATLGAFLACIGVVGVALGHPIVEAYEACTNLLLGGAGGGLAALIYVTWRYHKPDTTIIINAFITGLVSVSAGAALFWPIAAVFVGGVGGVLCAYIIPRLDQYKFDDPIGVTPVHLAGGIWGTLAVVFTGHIIGQLVGLAIILAVAVGGSALTWMVVKRITGLRCSLRAERHGLDMEAVGLEAYPDFPIRTAGRPDITQIDRY